jgi:hypothetical protein
MMKAEDIAKMSQDEKLFLLEIIWEDLSKTEISAPLWHEEALKETEARRAQGLEIAVDWKAAKDQLRSRFA